jgi:chromosome segregation ATPase
MSDSLEASMMKRIGELKAEVQHLKFILEEERQIAREDGAGLRTENARIKAECQARQAENSVLAVECDSLKAEVERLQSIHSIDSIGIEQLKAEVERLTSDIQMEKENEDRLVREWQKANNEVYGLKTQVAALIDDQTRLKAEVERLTKAGDNLVYVVSEHSVSEPFVKAWFDAKGVQS